MDGALAVGFLAIALRFTKTWLGVAMLMQSGELALHGAVMGDWGLPFLQYIILNNLLSFGLVLLLAGATTTAWIQKARRNKARRARHGGDARAAYRQPCFLDHAAVQSANQLLAMCVMRQARSASPDATM